AVDSQFMLTGAKRMTAILPKRLGDTKRVQKPRISRSHPVRFGPRRRERFMMSNWCLTASDSAATARTPPGPASRAKVSSRWAISLNNNSMRRRSLAPSHHSQACAAARLLPELPIRHTQVDCLRFSGPGKRSLHGTRGVWQLVSDARGCRHAYDPLSYIFSGLLPVSGSGLSGT